MIYRILALLTVINCQIDTITISTDQTQTIYSHHEIDSHFVMPLDTFDCSAFVYGYALNQEEFTDNLPTQVTLKQGSGSVSVSVSSYYGHFAPSINQSDCTGSSCAFQIRYNCPQILNTGNYFDIVQMSIPDVGQFSWYIKCNENFNPLYFEWGQLIVTILATVIIIVGTIFARLEAFNGSGIQFDWKWIIVLGVFVIAIGHLIIFAPDVASTFMDVVTWVIGGISVGLIILETFFRCIKHSFLKKSCNIGPIPIRLMDGLCLILGVGVVFIWWVSNKNWIISDVISVCIIISMMKIFKYTSLKTAVAMFIVILGIFVIEAIQAEVIEDKNFFFLFSFAVNNPFQFQIPAITPTYIVTCTWISILSVSMPGLLVAYLHRFDQSRATNIYVISSVIAYFFGSVIWNIISSFSRQPVPFDAVSSPFVLLTICFMAFNRKELRTLWDGTFYDEEFTNKDDIDKLSERLSVQMPQMDMVRRSISDDMYLQNNDFDYLKKVDNPATMELVKELLGNDQL